MTNEQLQTELERAYRCISGFYTTMRKGQLLDKTTLAYHSPTRLLAHTSPGYQPAYSRIPSVSR